MTTATRTTEPFIIAGEQIATSSAFAVEGKGKPLVIPIESIEDERIDVYARLTDLELRCRLEPEKGIFIAEGTKVIAEALRRGYEPISLFMEKRWLASIEATLADRGVDPAVALYVAPRELISQIAGYEVTRGALGAFRRRPPLSVQQVLEKARSIAVLVGITNAMNVGAIFRNAAALGVDGVLVDATSVDPLYRRTLRSSMGCALALPHARFDADAFGDGSGRDIVALLSSRGYTTIALALDERAVDITDIDVAGSAQIAMLLGSEGEGLPRPLIESSDWLATIPMARGVDSLNVAAASAIAFWELIRRLP